MGIPKIQEKIVFILRQGTVHCSRPASPVPSQTTPIKRPFAIIRPHLQPKIAGDDFFFNFTKMEITTSVLTGSLNTVTSPSSTLCKYLALRQPAITCANFDPDLFRHKATTWYNLIIVYVIIGNAYGAYTTSFFHYNLGSKEVSPEPTSPHMVVSPQSSLSASANMQMLLVHVRIYWSNKKLEAQPI